MGGAFACNSPMLDMETQVMKEEHGRARYMLAFPGSWAGVKIWTRKLCVYNMLQLQHRTIYLSSRYTPDKHSFDMCIVWCFCFYTPCICYFGRRSMKSRSFSLIQRHPSSKSFLPWRLHSMNPGESEFSPYKFGLHQRIPILFGI